MIVIDLSNYKGTGDKVSPGRYRVVVEDVEATESAAKNPMINMWLKIVGGDHDGATLVDRLVLTEKSLFRVVAFMKAIGLPTPKKRLQVNIESWKGRALVVDVDDSEPYNGRVRSEVKGYELAKSTAPAGQAGQDPLDAVVTASEIAQTPRVDVLPAADLGPVPDEISLDDLNL